MSITVTDLFAGAGGASTGATQVPGVEVRIAADHWAEAVDVHNANHPNADHICADISQYDPRRIPATTILWASPECFTAGHLVATTRGQVPIELVEVGDVVLTHRNRWREVVRVQARESSDLVTVKGQGHPGIVTTRTHRFWARPSDLTWQNDIRRYRRTYTDPTWVEARALTEANALWATPTVPEMIPTEELPPVFNQSDNGWWLLGRWLGDGSLSFGRNHEVTITCSYHEADELANTLSGTGVRWHRSEKLTAVVFTASCAESRDWLARNCGHGAAHKQTPPWATSLGEIERRGMLHGYMSADGCTTQRRHRASTVSRALAISIRLLAESLGHRVAMAYDKRTTYSIEGRSGVAKRQWVIHWEPTLSARRSPEAFERNNQAWSRVRSVDPVDGTETVYNIEVAEDHSYVLDGIIVKNCTNHSGAKGIAQAAQAASLFEAPDEAAARSRATMWEVPRFAEVHRYQAVIVENVVEAARWLPFQAWLMAMHSLGYEHRTVWLNSMHANRHGSPAPQSRDRMYVAFWRKGNRAPDLEAMQRPRAYCPTCETDVDAMQAWKKPDAKWGRYRSQYVYRCPSVACRHQVVEPYWLPAASAIDWSLPGTRIGDRTRPLAAKTRARIAAGIGRYWRPFTLEAAGHTYERRPGVRTRDVMDVMTTLHTTASKALAVPVEGRDGKTATPSSDPLRTMTTRNETGILTPFIAELRGGGSRARIVREPFATFAASGTHHGLVVRGYGTNASEPGWLSTPTTEPIRTLTGAGSQFLGTHDEPVTAAEVDDCFFRMLEPHEVAAGMAFPRDYIWQGTKRDRIRMAGNAVTPPAARDLIAAVVDSLEAAA